MGGGVIERKDPNEAADASADEQGAEAQGTTTLPPAIGHAVPVAALAAVAVPKAPPKNVLNGETNAVGSAALKVGTGGVATNAVGSVALKIGTGGVRRGDEDEQAGASSILEGAGVAGSIGGIRLGVLATARQPPAGDVAELPCPMRRGNENDPGVVSIAVPRGVRGAPGGTTTDNSGMPDPGVVADSPNTAAPTPRASPVVAFSVMEPLGCNALGGNLGLNS